jgi:hypothetical protein
VPGNTAYPAACRPALRIRFFQVSSRHSAIDLPAIISVSIDPDAIVRPQPVYTEPVARLFLRSVSRKHQRPRESAGRESASARITLREKYLSSE